MIRFKASFRAIQLDEARLKRAWKLEIDRAIREGVREMLKEMIKRIPVYTGESRGQLIPIARFVRLAVPIRPDPGSRKRFPGQGPDSGAAQTEVSFDQSKALTQILDIRFSVFQFLVNEFFDASGVIPLRNPGPYGSIEAGRKIYVGVVRKRLSGSLKIGKFTVRTNLNGR